MCIRDRSRLAAGGAMEEKVQGNPRSQVRRNRAGKRSLRAGEDQGTHPGISGGAPPGEESQGLDSMLRGASGRGQDLARHVDCESPVSYTHLRAHETVLDLVCRLLLEKK